MKKLFVLIAVIMITAFTSFAQQKFDNWPEMMEFHTILSQTYHPAEQGDLKPIKTRSHELLAHMKAVTASHKPQEYDNDDMKKALKRLEKEADKLNAIVVRQEQNTIIMKQFSVVHDAFHDVAGMCNKEEKKDKKDK